jgi:leucyl aminopeptidase
MSMKISLAAAANPFDFTTDVLIVGVAEGASTASGPLAELAKRLGPSLSRAIKRDEFSGKKDQVLDLATNDALPASRVVVMGMGAGRGETDVRLLAAKGARFANGARAHSLALVLPEGIDGAERAAAEGLVLGGYRFTKYLTGDRLPKQSLDKLTLLVPSKVTKSQRDAVALGQRVGDAVCIARDLINEPPNELYPELAAADAAVRSARNGLEVKVFDRRELEKRGMKLLVAVGRGARREPHLVHMTYKPKGKAKKRLVFVGKGLTFDTGGICIKPAPGMEEMKGDMGGAANVIALMAAVAATKPNVEVHGIIGCAENMPDGDAYRPGDVFGSLDGKTVEIINTDAEGRLVLADASPTARPQARPHARQRDPHRSACVVALGPTVSGFYANRDELAERMRRPRRRRARRCGTCRSSKSSARA